MTGKKLTLNQVVDQLKTGEEYLIVIKEDKMILVVDDDNHTRRLYRITHEYPMMLEEIEIDYEAMAEKLAKGLDPVALMRDVLRSTEPDALLEVKERLEHPSPSVKGDDGCFRLFIGGKRGRPFELNIREVE